MKGWKYKIYPRHLVVELENPFTAKTESESPFSKASTPQVTSRKDAKNAASSLLCLPLPEVENMVIKGASGQEALVKIPSTKEAEITDLGRGAQLAAAFHVLCWWKERGLQFNSAVSFSRAFHMVVHYLFMERCWWLLCNLQAVAVYCSHSHVILIEGPGGCRLHGTGRKPGPVSPIH